MILFGNCHFQDGIFDCIQPIAEIFDRYATICNEVISFAIFVLLRFYEMIINIASPVEILSNICVFLITLVFSLIFFLIRETFYLLTLPVRIFSALLVSHPMIVVSFVLLTVLSVLVIILIIRQISLLTVCQIAVRIAAPYIRRFCYTIFLYLCPQYYIFLSVIRFLFAPVGYAFDACKYLLGQDAPRRRLPQRRSSNCASELERIMCCICMEREKSVLLQPCNHICLCGLCADELSESYRPVCPLCRTVIVSHTDVYL